MRAWVPLLAVANPCIPVLETPGGGAWVPPDNSWPSFEPPDDLVGEGWSEGMVAPNMKAIDQHGDEVQLWQFYGMVVVLDVSTIWCAPCQALARDVQETQEDYDKNNFIYLTLLPENARGEIPSVEELNQDWAEPFGIEAPVLSDTDQTGYTISPNGLYPWVLVIGRDMVVVEDQVSPAEDGPIRKAIESAI